MSLEGAQSVRGKRMSTCLVGNGAWGSKIKALLELHNFFDFKGVIDTKTSLEDKKAIIESADFVYIAIPSDAQYEYLMLSIAAGKKIVCESPFLNSVDYRRMVRKTIARYNHIDFLYVNYPYLFDTLFLTLSSAFASKGKVNYINVKCSGPKHYQEDLDLQKKLYANQALAVIFRAAQFKGEAFSNIVFKEQSGIVQFGEDFTAEFSYGYSETNQLQIIVRGPAYAEERNFTYDEFDQVIPMLNYFMNYHKSPERSAIMTGSGSRTFIDEAIMVEQISDFFVGLKGNEHSLSMEEYMMASSADQ
jgi:hypothetical protein